MKEYEIEITRSKKKEYEIEITRSQRNLDMDLPGDLVFGVPGKSAYEYAREGGYTGSEEDFRKKMAELGNFTGGVDFEIDASLTLENGILSVNTTNSMEQNNTLPITSAGVFATVGNIEVLLKTI